MAQVFFMKYNKIQIRGVLGRIVMIRGVLGRIVILMRLLFYLYTTLLVPSAQPNKILHSLSPYLPPSG